MIYTIVNAFTGIGAKGNPAAVCILKNRVSDNLMQTIASHLKLSETAFLIKEDDTFNLRWFTPATEVDLCGHATLASAHLIWEEGLLKKDQEAFFETKSGRLIARNLNDVIEMDFPSEEVVEAVCPEEIATALGIKPVFTGKNRFDYLIEAESAEAVKGLSPNFEMLKKIDCRGVIVTSRSVDSGYDFISRFFAPRVGVPEDPVTGSAHCALGPYWAQKTGKNSFTAFQASELGGIVKVEVKGKKINLGGKALTVDSGEYIV